MWNPFRRKPAPEPEYVAPVEPASVEIVGAGTGSAAERARGRLARIAESRCRIEARIAAGDPKTPELEARLTEFDEEVAAIRAAWTLEG